MAVLWYGRRMCVECRKGGLQSQTMGLTFGAVEILKKT